MNSSTQMIPVKDWISHVGVLSDKEEITKYFESYRPLASTFSMDAFSDNLYIKKYKNCLYYGQMIDELREGKGILCYYNGRIYEGDWKSDYKQGKGIEIYSNGGKYQGEFFRGKKQGKGIFKWVNGEIYDGEWKEGLKNGSGLWKGIKGRDNKRQAVYIETWSSHLTRRGLLGEGDSYVGEWKEGKTDGFGVHSWMNGDRYEGEFQQCLKHGVGTERFTNGDIYVGSYLFGKPEGYGEYYWSNGNIYKGHFVNGLRHGRGLWTAREQNGDKYEGEYRNDKKSGYGEYIWLSGNEYKGNFENDLRHGYGEMYWRDGEVYKGYWLNGVQTGQVVEIQKDEEKGEWQEEEEGEEGNQPSESGGSRGFRRLHYQQQQSPLRSHVSSNGRDSISGKTSGEIAGSRVGARSEQSSQTRAMIVMEGDGQHIVQGATGVETRYSEDSSNTIGSLLLSPVPQQMIHSSQMYQYQQQQQQIPHPPPPSLLPMIPIQERRFSQMPLRRRQVSMSSVEGRLQQQSLPSQMYQQQLGLLLPRMGCQPCYQNNKKKIAEKESSSFYSFVSPKKSMVFISDSSSPSLSPSHRISLQLQTRSLAAAARRKSNTQETIAEFENLPSRMNTDVKGSRLNSLVKISQQPPPQSQSRSSSRDSRAVWKPAGVVHLQEISSSLLAPNTANSNFSSKRARIYSKQF